MNILLSRDEFNKQVFKRDHNKCIVCQIPAIDVHHLIERKLFEDSGNYLNNGVSLCADHHILAEQTVISCDELREKAGITEIIIPDHLDPTESYDKWGNILLKDGTRSPGELFYDENVQKVLSQAGVLSLFRPYFRYPKTYHLPFSPGVSNGDKVLKNTDHFNGKEVVVTEKMDGECTTLYPDYIHPRSVNPSSHPSMDWIKAFHAKFKFDIPKTFRLCGENAYAFHSLKYEDLEDYFFLFSIWEAHRCLSWDDTLEWSSLLGTTIAPVIYRGIWDLNKIKSIANGLDFSKHEGFVVRTTKGFHMKDFKNHVAKVVRAGHVQTDEFWRSRPVVPNKLKKKI